MSGATRPSDSGVEGPGQHPDQEGLSPQDDLIREDDLIRDADLIRSRRNPLVRSIRQLHQPRGRRDAGLLLLEGTHLLQEVLQLRLQPRDLLLTPRWEGSHPELVAALPASTRLHRVSDEVLAAAATTEHPDGVVLTLPLPPSASSTLPGFLLVLDRLQDPGNLGTLMRTALAAGVERLWLAGGADPFQPKVLRASAGSALALPLERLEEAELCLRLRQAREAGYQVVAALAPSAVEAEAASIPYWQLDWRRPTILLLGNEGGGLSRDLLTLASHRVTIPHSPAVESLNVAVAAAPLLLERWRQGILQRATQPQERMPHQ
ncbi:RNA methyltransferase [Synechococcus sp. CS-1328]|uniref:TrmH family RNA methyltransferase n=1 Tax=Synechococcus sp. CS-1328 TaxID=2847976 RepID=UPI00223B7F5E|nr:RNA methyltransferase [Synechococcus sp. CS-1328]MCT0223610.1 RNA methyltransferase [Synechococcus sp. CS-1328]